MGESLLSSLLASRAGKLALPLLLAAQASAFTFTSIPSPNLNLNDLGRVAFVGDFDSVSLYQFEGQNENTTSVKSAIYSRYPNGVFAAIQETDADIKAMCPYQDEIVIGGNFTSVNGQFTPGGIAMLNPDDGSVRPLEGLNGSVNALYCDSDREQVYVGGSFTGGNSSNAIVWNEGWNPMPFQGFNGPVNSIVPGANDMIIFGGEFSGLGGNASVAAENNTQVLPIASANLTAESSSQREGLSDPQNIVCKGDPDTQGEGNTWLLADNSPGSWQAKFGFGFRPNVLRLHNTNFEGRGTKTFRFTALPDTGIMNLTFIGQDGERQFCDATCPLPGDNTTAQEFEFVNSIGMNSFRIDISDWYGEGGGLNGIELFQDEIYTYAISEFNEPQCGGVTTGASSTATGPWRETPSFDSNSMYLTAVLQEGEIDANTTNVEFKPDIRQSGNYSVTVFTPGCRGDDTCGSRGRVSITGSMAEDADEPVTTELFQTNEFDKYDEVYLGYMDATNGFEPAVTLAPIAGQATSEGFLTVVAQRVRFQLKKATSGNLNGLFEYDPEEQDAEIDFSESVIDSAGASLDPREEASITTLATDSNRLYVGGNFSSDDGRNNIFFVRNGASNASSMAGNGLNSQVMALLRTDDALYVGGNFTNTQDDQSQDLNGLAAYVDNEWRPLGAGVNGVVMYIVPFSLNITSTTPTTVLGISGFFDQVNSFDDNDAFPAEGFAVWVPSEGNWLHNLDATTIAVQGRLMTFTDVPNADRVFGGSLSSGSLSAMGAAVLENGESLSLGAFSADIQAQQQQTPLRKRAIARDQNLTTTGVLAATFYQDGENANKTIMAGHFAATGTDGQNITDVLIIDGNDENRVTGFDERIDANSTFAALGVQDGILYAGGVVSGQLDDTRVAGIVAYDLDGDDFAGTQPPPLQGTNVTVNSIAPRRNSRDIFVGGQFQSAGDLSCPALCVWNAERNQWTNPGGDLSGVVSTLLWITDTKLLIAGNLTAGNNETSIISYDSESSEFTEITGASDLPGPVTTLTQATNDGSEIWAAGETADGSAFLQRFDGNNWLPVNDMLGPGTKIRGLQVISLVEDHEDSDLIAAGQDLLLLGSIQLTDDFGSASAVLFNGTAMIPFLLSTTAQNTAGSLSQLFVENPNFFMGSSGGSLTFCSLSQDEPLELMSRGVVAHDGADEFSLAQNSKPDVLDTQTNNGTDDNLALGFIVLIALAIALALTFLLVVAGVLVEYYRKKAQGYSPAPTTSYSDRLGNVGRVPPEQLFGTLSGPRAPAI